MDLPVIRLGCVGLGLVGCYLPGVGWCGPGTARGVV